MAGLKQFVERLVNANLTAEVWIDPNDVDVIVRCDANEMYDFGTVEQREALDWVIVNQKSTLKCDSYTLFEYPPTHPLHKEGHWWYSYWHVKWGFNRAEDPKGIVVISLDGTAP